MSDDHHHLSDSEIALIADRVAPQIQVRISNRVAAQQGRVSTDLQEHIDAIQRDLRIKTEEAQVRIERTIAKFEESAEDTRSSVLADLGGKERRRLEDALTGSAREHVADLTDKYSSDLAGMKAGAEQSAMTAQAAFDQLSDATKQAADGRMLDAYSTGAREARLRSFAWTMLSLSVAAVAAVLGYRAVDDAAQIETGEAIVRTGITASILIAAGFLAKLAGDERRDARNWKHMQLQLSTSLGYVANLPEGMRDKAQFALAMRFFPGQAQDPHGPAAAGADFDVAALIDALPKVPAPKAAADDDKAP